MRACLLVVILWLGSVVARGDSFNDGDDEDRYSNYHGPSVTSDKEASGPTRLAFVRCPTDRTTLFVRNETGGFVEVDPTTSSSTDGSLRGSYSSSSSSDGNAKETAEAERPQYYRSCWCTQYFDRENTEYCPAELSMCVVHGKDGPVRCQSYSGRDSFAQFIWPFGFFFVCLTMVMFVATSRGKYAWQFLWRKARVHCCPKQRRLYDNGDDEQEDDNETPLLLTDEVILTREANRLLAQDGRPSLLGEDVVRRESRRVLALNALQQQQEPRPREKPKRVKQPWALRTKSFCSVERSGGFSTSGTSSDGAMPDYDDDEQECAICFDILQPGDVVGNIPCGHVFHKDCIKAWVVKTWKKKRTRCPLCQDRDLVSLHLRSEDGVDTQKSSAEDDVIEQGGPPNRGRAQTGMSTTDSDTTSDADQEAPSNNSS